MRPEFQDSNSHRPNILILDDDVSFLRACDSSLSNRYNVIPARTLKEATDLFAQQPFEVMIIDYWLGVQTAEEFLDLAQTSSPCIIISGDANKEVAIKLLNRQVFGLLEKPIQFDALVEAIDRAILSTSDQPRTTPQKGDQTKVNFQVNPQTRRVQYGSTVSLLTPSEMQILLMLIEADGTTVGREIFIRTIWGRVNVSRSTLDTHILNLKKKLPPIEAHLNSVYGAGYFLDLTALSFSMQNVPI